MDECPSTASTRASGCSTSTPTSASTAALRAGLSGRGDLLRGRHPPRSGRSTTTPTCTSSTRSAYPAAPPRPGALDLDHPIIGALPPQNQEWLCGSMPGGRPRTSTVRRGSGVPLGHVAEAKALAAAHPTDWSTSRSARRSTRLPTRSRKRSPKLLTPTATRPSMARPRVRQAAVDWLGRRFDVTGLDRRPGAADHRLQGVHRQPPDPAGARSRRPGRRAGARLPDVRGRSPVRAVPGGGVGLHGPARTSRPAIVYLNSPANPHGRILGADHLRKMIAWTRERGSLSSPTSAT